MSTIARPDSDVVWWQGNLFTIKGRGEQTGGALGLAEAKLWPGMATPLHVHHREDEAFYILEGQIRFRRGEEEFSAGPGDFVFGPREVPHSFRVLDGGARMLVLVTPAGLEHMFIEGGTPVRHADEPPPQHYDMERIHALAEKYGWDVIGPPMA
jgi:mannose-6-phosphate isomerase-like protein (cupin superfamily)